TRSTAATRSSTTTIVRRPERSSSRSRRCRSCRCSASNGASRPFRLFTTENTEDTEVYSSQRTRRRVTAEARRTRRGVDAGGACSRKDVQGFCGSQSVCLWNRKATPEIMPLRRESHQYDNAARHRNAAEKTNDVTDSANPHESLGASALQPISASSAPQR